MVNLHLSIIFVFELKQTNNTCVLMFLSIANVAERLDRVGKSNLLALNVAFLLGK